MFTKQQIEEIATKLRYLSKKDTDLPLTDNVNYNDCILTIVSGGNNYKISVSDFFKIIKSDSIELIDGDNTTIINSHSITTLLLKAEELRLINPTDQTDIVIIKNTTSGLNIGKDLIVDGNIEANNASLDQIDAEILNVDNVNVSEDISVEGTIHADDEIDSSEDITSSKNINAGENVIAEQKVHGKNDVEAGTGANKVALKETNTIAKGWYIDKVNPEETESTVRDKFVLKDVNGTIHGDPIKIYKDSAIHDSKLGYANATVNSTTGIINIGTAGTGEISGHPQYLVVSVYTQDGTYAKISINFSQFIIENEFDVTKGLGVSNNVVYIKLASDATTTKYIHFVDGVLTMTSELDDQVSNCEYQAGRAEDAADNYNDVIKPAAQTATTNANTATTNANNAADSANSAASDATSAATNANTAAATIGTDEDEADPDGTIWARYKDAEGTPTDEADEDGSRWARFNNAEETRSAAIVELQQTKANKDGYYSQLTAGAAENLVGGNKMSRELTFSTAGGSTDIADGVASIEKIKGNSIVWNQAYKENLNNWVVSGGTKTIVEHGVRVTRGDIGSLRIDTRPNAYATASHVYIIVYNIYTDGTLPSKFELNGVFSPLTNIRIGRNIFRKVAVTNNSIIGSVAITNGTYLEINRIMFINLTRMFGAGNEPATISEFESLFPLDYYQYNTGEVINLNATGIKTIGFNQYNHNDPHINVFAQAYYIGGTYTSLWFSKSKTDTTTAYTFGDVLSAGSFYTNGSTHYKANSSAAAYDSSKTYPVGAYCIESSVVYKCNIAIDTAEAFDATKWTSFVDIAGMVTDGILTSVEITSVDHLFTPAEQGYVHVEGGNATNTVVNLHWSGKRDGEYEPYLQSTRNIPIAKINTDGTITDSAVGKTRLFPDGLCKAGSVYDEITPTKAIKRIGKVDLGSLDWDIKAVANTDFSVFRADIQTGKRASKNAICLNYNVATTTTMTSLPNKNIFAIQSLYWSSSALRTVIRNDSYVSATAFKAAMSGVYLYYELETPIEVTFAEPINLNYQVSDFGTEQMLPINTDEPTSAPLTFDVAYGLNVVDFVRNADKNYLTIEDSTGNNGSSFTNLRSALSTSFGIDIVPTYDSTNKRYTFAITDNRKVEVPTSSTSSGTKGTWAVDNNAVYFCVDTNTWVKINKTTW